MLGFRPTVAEAMPREYRDLMTACWAEDPAQRPSFEEIESALCDHYCAFASCRRAGVPCRPRACCGGAQESPAAAPGGGCRKGACG
jgi:hypothetical protein